MACLLVCLCGGMSFCLFPPFHVYILTYLFIFSGWEGQKIYLNLFLFYPYLYARSNCSNTSYCLYIKLSEIMNLAHLGENLPAFPFGQTTLGKPRMGRHEQSGVRVNWSDDDCQYHSPVLPDMPSSTNYQKERINLVNCKLWRMLSRDLHLETPFVYEVNLVVFLFNDAEELNTFSLPNWIVSFCIFNGLCFLEILPAFSPE